MIKRNNKKIQLISSFLLPFIIIIISYIVAGIAPFGNRSLMSMDAYGQYFPMLSGMKNKVSEWSFTGGLGFNQLAQSAYYTNSPLWLILYFIPKEAMISTIDMIVGLRFALAGLTSCLWLRENHKKTHLTTVAFSTAYSLSAYSLAFINQFMWMDLVILLPLIAIGLKRLFMDKKPYIYIVSLALALYTNFYIAYMVCIFSIIYFIYLCFHNKISWKKRLIKSVHFFISSLLSGGLVAVVLIPTYLVLNKTISSTLTFNGDLKFYHSPLKLLVKLLPFSKISLAFEAPNLYCGFIVVILCLIYFFKKDNSLRSRVIFISIVVFSYLSLNFNLLDFIWHGFHFPNQLPARQSFILIFAMISLGFSVFIQIERDRKVIANIITVILIIGISANSVYTLSTQTWKGSVDRYTIYDEDMGNITNKYNSEEHFYRMEFLTPAYNLGQRYGYNGIGYYSSTMSANAYNFFENIGMDIYARRVSTKYVPSNILNAIFGVKYLFETEDDWDKNLFIYEKEHFDKITLYENPYALPIAFSVDPSVLDLDMNQASDLQNEILKHMIGDKSGNTYSNEEDFAKAINKLKDNSLEITSFSETDITGTIDNSKDSILYTSIPNDGGWSAYVDGKKTELLTVFDYLCSIPLTEGKHTIRLVYRTPGIKLGSVISFISIIGFLIYSYSIKKMQQREKG